MTSDKKSQSATEFLILTGVIIFFFTVFFVAVEESMSDKIKEEQTDAVKEIALTVQNEINLALKSSEGYYREFKVPMEVSGKDYDVTIVEEMVYVKTTDNKHAIALPVTNTTGQITKGANIIKKQGGIIYINP